MTWELIGAGRQRLVYRRTGSNYVLKVPCNDEGFHDNGYEARTYRKNNGRIRGYPDRDTDGCDIMLARCRLLPSGCLVMEYAQPIYTVLPKWSDYVDGQQVGVTRDGRIVAYDYGWYLLV